MSQREIRALSAPVEVRAAGSARSIAGYAAVFNSEADIGGYFREVIAPGAFANTINGDVRALFNHDTGDVLGRTVAGTLRLSEDAKGLAVEIDLPDTQTARDLSVSMERGDIDGMSFGFEVTKQAWDETVDPPLRTIHEVNLFEVSVVTFPAYADTSIALRSLSEARKEIGKRNSDAASRRISARKAELAMRERRISPAA